MVLDQDILMKNELLATVVFLMEKGLRPVLYGSYALGLYLDTSSLDPQDIDLAFSSREAHDEAVTAVEQERGFALIKEFEWISGGGGLSVNTILRSKEGVLFDFSFSLGDLQVNLEASPILSLGSALIPVLSLLDLKKSYELFGHEKPGSERKLALIEGLINRESSKK